MTDGEKEPEEHVSSLTRARAQGAVGATCWSDNRDFSKDIFSARTVTWSPPKSSRVRLMGCSKWRAAFDCGQSKRSVLLTMIILLTYLFYCLNGYCYSLPRPVFDQQTRLPIKIRLNERQEESAKQRSASHAATVQEQASNLSFSGVLSNNMSIANNFGSKKFPQAIIIGVKKGGTRALLEFLRIHPDVRAVGAEPHFFDRFYDKGLEWYRWAAFHTIMHVSVCRVRQRYR